MEKRENYELEERAAIREFDAGQSRTEAEFYARLEIEARDARQESNQLQPIPQKACSRIKALRKRREAISKQMGAAKDEKRKTKLFVKWMELTNQILELRKAR